MKWSVTDQGEDPVGVCGGWDGGHRQGGEGVVAYARPDDGHGSGMVDTDRGLREQLLMLDLVMTMGVGRVGWWTQTMG